MSRTPLGLAVAMTTKTHITCNNNNDNIVINNNILHNNNSTNINVIMLISYGNKILFTIYVKPLSDIIDSHSVVHHLFADDLQFQMSAKRDKISELLHSMQSGVNDVKF